MLLALVVCAGLGSVQDPDPLALPGFTPRSQTVRGADGTDVAAVRRDRAIWPVANGLVFAYAGYGQPANRLEMITGPQYQTRGNHEPHGAFGSQWIEVLRDDAPLPTRQRTWTEAVRAAAIRTDEQFDGGYRLETIDFALAGSPVIVRRVLLHRPARDTGRIGLRLAMSELPDGAATLDELVLRKSYRKPPETFRLALTPLPSDAISVRGLDGALYVDLLRSGDIAFDLALVMSRDADDEARNLAMLRSKPLDEHLTDALDAWRREFADTLTVWPDGPLRQHVESVKKLVLAQRSAPNGGVAPMVSFKGVWARDSNGPLKTFLWMGRPDLARDLLRYYRSASALARATRREYPLDLPVSRAPVLDAAAWGETGTDRCEVPSWIVLQHAWYFDATGDGALIREAYPYLRRNALHQESFAGPAGPLQRFNGDETYLHGAFYALFPQRATWPNQFPRASAWSLDSLVVRDAALRALERLGPLADESAANLATIRTTAAEVRASIEQTFWLPDLGMYAPALSPLDLTPHRAPYAPINLRLLWLGTHAADDPRALANLDATIALLRGPDGLCRSTPSVAAFIGALPGYWLANLAAVDDPLAWDVLPRVLATASADGAWSEVHGPDGRADASYNPTWPNRYRPWESGLVMDGVLRFLTGAQPSRGRAITLRPHRPNGLELERLGPLPVGASRLMLHYPKNRNDDFVRVELVGGPPCDVNGQSVQPGRDVFVELVAPRNDRTTPAARAFDSTLTRPAGERLVVGTLRDPRPLAGDVPLDAGLPFAPQDLAALLFDADGARRYATVVLEPSARRVDRETMKPATFWTDPALVDAFAKFEAAGGLVERPDNLAEWWLCGPFPNPESRGLMDESRPVTAPFDPKAEFAVPGAAKPATWWRKVSNDDRLELYPPAGPREHVCVFARTIVRAARARAATLLLGSDDGCRVWLNGALVFESIAHRHLTPDEFAVPIELVAGDNVLVIGVENQDGGFGLAARIR